MKTIPSHPRLLYLDMNVRFIDPTRQTLAFVYKGASDIVFYGPGYVDLDTLAQGPDRFLEENGPFDFIVGNELLVFYPEFPEIAKQKYHKAFPDEAFKFWKQMYEFFCRSKMRKIVNLLEFDFYTMNAAQRDILEGMDAWFLSYNHQNILCANDMKFVEEEKFAPFVNDHFYHVVQQKRDKFIPLITCMAETEFWWAPLAQRRQEWAVPGAAYWARREARKQLGLEERKIRLPGIMQLYAVMSRLNIQPFANRLLLQNYNLIFNKGLEETKYVYTCGSGLEYPLRKFFEIPSHGCVLICLPFAGFEDFGFKDGMNCVVALPEQLSDLNRFLKANPEKAQAIAEAGRNLIWEKHRLSVRSIQLKEALQTIRDGKFLRAEWRDGEFVIETQADSERAAS